MPDETTADSERKAFEEWFEADCMPLEADWFTRDLNDASEYRHEATAHAWRGWAARAGVQQ